MNTLELLIPAISIAVGIIPLFFVKRNLFLFVLALGAYFVAIISKEIIQLSFLGFFLTHVFVLRSTDSYPRNRFCLSFSSL